MTTNAGLNMTWSVGVNMITETEPAGWGILDDEPEEWCQDCEQQKPLAGEGDDENVGEMMFADADLPGDWTPQYDGLVAQEYLEWSLRQEHRADLMGHQATIDQEEDNPPHRMGPSFGPQPRMCKPGTMGYDDEGTGGSAPKTPNKEQAEHIDEELARRLRAYADSHVVEVEEGGIPENVQESLRKETVMEHTASNRVTREQPLTLAQAVDWYCTGNLPRGATTEGTGRQEPADTPRMERGDPGESAQDRLMTLTQAMQLWEREEEEELRLRVEWTDTRRQVAAFDLWGDRPHTIWGR